MVDWIARLAAMPRGERNVAIGDMGTTAALRYAPPLGRYASLAERQRRARVVRHIEYRYQLWAESFGD